MCACLVMAALVTATPLLGVDWPQFRGPNGSGVSASRGMPVEFGEERNLVWKSKLPSGYSSPVLTGEHVYLTGFEGRELWTICLKRQTGEEVWRRASPKTLAKKPKGPNSPVSPSPATDGVNVYSFFEAFGLVSYDPSGKERWRLPMGPFNTPYGLGASPVVFGGKLVMAVDQDTGSYLMAVDKDSGEILWKTDRPRATHGFSSPVLYEPDGGEAQLLLLGSFRLTSYSLATGTEEWWVDGMGWQAKSMPVLGPDGTIYVHSWMASPAEMGFPSKTPPFEQMLAANDADGDGKLSKEETPDEELRKYWFLFDLDKDNYLTERDWGAYRARNEAKNGLFAIRPEGSGDITAKAVKWVYRKGLPNIPSPLLYEGVVYALKEGGILTALDAETGKVLKQGRVKGALDAYFASPVAADGKIYTVSKEGKAAVLKAGHEWEVLRVNELGEEVWATPAIADGKLYIRTQEAMYCFGGG